MVDILLDKQYGYSLECVVVVVVAALAGECAMQMMMTDFLCLKRREHCVASCPVSSYSHDFANAPREYHDCGE